MGKVAKNHIVSVSDMSDDELKVFLKKNVMSLTVDEVRSLPKKLGRDPTLTELFVFNIQWSEHSSYKSSKKWLKLLPTTGSQVIIGPVEDSGVVKLGEHGGETYGIVISHESHNHPSQVVPFEGAATGIGGIVRDVLCMGGSVIATADPLRFGNPKGKNKNKVQYIANSVVDGIAGYGNPLGVPVIAGDTYFNDSFDDNCLVNVVCLGIVKEKNIIHSYAPPCAENYDVIIVGKATDISGFGGAAFASVVLDESEEESNKGAVQVPDPFLKNMLIRATTQVFREVAEKNIKVGFKDMGAGGIMCATSEMGSDAGFGVEIDLDKIHVSMDDLPPYVIAAAETQERFTWFVPSSFTKRVLEIYNDEFELPKVAKGARASLVGKVTKEKIYKLTHKGEVVCNVPIDEVTKGVSHERPFEDPQRTFTEPDMQPPKDSKGYGDVLKKLLNHPNICSKERVYKHYDTEVQGNAVIRPGEGDAGLIAPIRGSSLGVALSVDGNPRYNAINPLEGAKLAVAEAMRNVACIGAIPTAMTDCLNYGNPERKEGMWEFVQGVKGIAEASKNLYYHPQKDQKSPVPIVSGNVSFYNMSASGSSVNPSPIISCLGVVNDYSKCITTALKKNNSHLYLVGTLRSELGGSAYYDLFGELGKNIPTIDYEEEREKLYLLIDAISKGLLLSAHDVSDGGVGVTLAEMCILGQKGAKINLVEKKLSVHDAFFTETPAIVVEVDKEKVDAFEKFVEKRNCSVKKIGLVQGDELHIQGNGVSLVCLPIKELETAWRTGYGEVIP